MTRSAVWRNGRRWALLWILLGAGCATQADGKERRPTADGAAAVLASAPLRFEPNYGQAGRSVRFVARGARYTVALEDSAAILQLGSRRGGSVKMRLVGATAPAAVEGDERLDATSNYFLGSQPSDWIAGIPNYARVRYRGVYPGVDLVFYGVDGQLEYDFVLESGADPNVVRIAFEGAAPPRVDGNGDLILSAGSDRLRQRAPVIYQGEGALRRSVPGHYVVKGNTVRFEVARYDRTRPLVIDPRLVYSTLLGGDGFDEGVTVAADTQGNAYVTGWTNSTNLPGTAGFFQRRAGGGPGLGDAFVAKVSAAGKLLYTTYLGGSGEDAGWGIAVDSLGAAYVAGFTSSGDFPTTAGAYQKKLAGTRNCFVTKLNPGGTALAYSTYVGGSGTDSCLTLAIDSLGNAYISGSTTSANFPVTKGAFQASYGGGTDVMVTKLNPTGTGLAYSTYLGGSSAEQANSIVTDASGNAYVAGFTLSANFPVIAGSLQTTFGGGSLDSFVTKVNSAGTGLVYSTFLGGNGDEYARAVVVDGNGNAYVAGRSGSSNFAVTPGAFQAAVKGQWNTYCLKLNAAGAALLYSTLLGGTVWDQAEGLAIDAVGRAWVAGITRSPDFPVTADALQNALRGAQAGTITHLNAAGTALIYSSYIGGGDQDAATWVTLDAAGNAYITGEASSAAFPVTADAAQGTFGGGIGDAFAMRLDACTIGIGASAQAFPSSSGSGTVNVNASSGCTWAASTKAAWLTFNGSPAGAGNGSVGFTVAANPGPARTAIVNVGDQALTIAQDGSSACGYGINPTAEIFDLNGGTGSVAVSAAAGCTWSATSSVPWITVSSGGNGTGAGTVLYSVAPATAERTGVLILAGIPLTVSQTATGPVCNYRVSSVGQAFGSGGGTGGLSVASDETCQWSATSAAPWIQVIGGSAVRGNGSVTFAVAPNPAGTRRTAVLSAGGQAVTIAQDGACTYSLSTAGMAFDLSGGGGAISVAAAAGCPWTAASSTDWIAVTSGASGSGNGTVAFSVSAAADARSGTLLIGGTTFTVSQFVLAQGCSYAITPAQQAAGAAGGAGLIAVTAADGCPWTAAGNDWLSLNTPGGTGTGTIAFAAAANAGGPRTGNIIVAGQVVTVAQAGACNYRAGASGQTFDLGGGSGWVAINAEPGCAWTAASNADWIGITSAASGSGSGILTYAAAGGNAARSGTITIAGQTYTIAETDASANCAYSAAPARRSFTTAGGSGTLSVKAPAACTWHATASDPWIVLSGDTGQGNGAVGFAVAPNSGGSTRTGAISVAGLNIAITEPGTCSYSVAPAVQNFELSGGAWVATVTADPGCSWTAASDSPWLTLTSGDSGTGSGVVGYSVGPSSVARSGGLNIAGARLLVNQTNSSQLVPIRIRCGGTDYTDPWNQLWSADTSFSGGGSYTAAGPVSGTATPDLYQAGHTGGDGFQYRFPAANGSYTVNLKFAEPSFAQSGQRVFHVLVNGQVALANFDIAAQAGGAQIAVDQQIPVTVSDGRILIQFLPVVDSPIVSAIEIVPQTGVAIAVNPGGALVTPGQQQAFAAAVSGSDNTAVTWSMNPQVGTLSADGVYSAPDSISQPQTIAVTATSAADPSRHATATIALAPGPVQ